MSKEGFSFGLNLCLICNSVGPLTLTFQMSTPSIILMVFCVKVSDLRELVLAVSDIVLALFHDML